MESIAETLQQAVLLHQHGELKRAESAYYEILRIDPGHADALHLLGVAAHQQNNHRSALDYIGRAITANPAASAYHNNLSAAHRALGDDDKAIACLREAIRLDPHDADAWFNLGAVQTAATQHGEAAAAFRRCLEFDENHAAAHLQLANVLCLQKQFSDAVGHYERALQICPDLCDAHFRRANALRAQGDVAQAVDAYKKTLSLQPNHAKAHNNLGSLLHDQGDVEQALPHYRRAMAINPDYVEALNNLATAQKDREEFDEAIALYRKATALDPSFPEAHFNLGNLYRERGESEKAVPCYEQTLQCNPNHEGAGVNLGVAFKELHRLDDAKACYDRLLIRDPEFPAARFNRSLVWLLDGDFERGWPEYEWRFRYDAPPPRFHFPTWDGSSLEGRTILVFAEQGVGDEVMFASCLPEVISRAEHCIVECDKRLVPLMSRSFPSARFVPKPADQSAEQLMPPIDVQIATGSLPQFFRSTSASFPDTGRYLIPDSELCEFWLARMAELGEGLKVGISWRGGKENEVRRKRSTQLDQWKPILKLPGVRFVNMQYGNVGAELETVEQELGVTIHDWDDADPLTDLEGFAAQISSLDLIVSVDNSTVHIAGALGMPVWTFLCFASDWRWMLDGKKTPWYDSMTLFRQTKAGHWDAVFEHIARALSEISE